MATAAADRAVLLGEVERLHVRDAG
jgi:hypothetical protein